MNILFFVCGFLNDSAPRNYRECETLQEAEKYAQNIMAGHWLIPGNKSQIWINKEAGGWLNTILEFSQTGAAQVEKVVF